MPAGQIQFTACLLVTSWYTFQTVNPRSRGRLHTCDHVPEVSFLSALCLEITAFVRHSIILLLIRTGAVTRVMYNYYIVTANVLIIYKYTKCTTSLVAQRVKNPPAVQDTWVWSLGWEDLLEAGTAIHFSMLAWRIPMDRTAWQAAVHGVTKSQTQLNTAHSTYRIYTLLLF